MNYRLLTSPLAVASDCLILGLCKNGDTPEFIYPFPTQLQSLLTRLAAKLHEAGDWVYQADVDHHGVILIHCGTSAEFSALHLSKRVNDLTTLVLKQRFTSITLCLPAIINQAANWQLQQMIIQLEANCFQLLDYKTKNHKPHALADINLCLNGADDAAIATAQATACGIHLTRRLADLPANRCTPSYLGQQAQQLARDYDCITTQLFDNTGIRQMGMEALLAVAQGSNEPACFIDINYQGAANKSDAPIILVGKGITFDSGGLTIKPGNAMDEMKYDMAGAASVLGAIKACAELRLPLNVIGLIASSENMPSGSAVKPGDIVISMSGQTIEILNTDAEGRLALADALTYAERFNPRCVIDIATLTGAMMVALGDVYTGFMTDDEALATQILQASADSGDKCWRMPLDDAYQDALDSPLADMINAGFNRSAGAITAACFLSRFTKKYPWLHLDIAGTAWVSGKKRHASGRPVPLLINFLSHAAYSR